MGPFIRMEQTYYTIFLVMSLFVFGETQGLYSIDPDGSQIQSEGHHLEGKIINDRYYAPNQLFSIAVPSPANERYTEDHYSSSNMAGVAFYNDYGFFVKVEVDGLPMEVRSIICQDPQIKVEILDALFYDKMIPQLKRYIPTLEVLHEHKIVLDNGEPALFGILNLPQAATLVDKKTGLNMDSKRGYLLTFSKDYYLINFTMQDTVSLMPILNEAPKKSLDERLLSYLMRIQRTFAEQKNK